MAAFLRLAWPYLLAAVLSALVTGFLASNHYGKIVAERDKVISQRDAEIERIKGRIEAANAQAQAAAKKTSEAYRDVEQRVALARDEGRNENAKQLQQAQSDLATVRAGAAGLRSELSRLTAYYSQSGGAGPQASSDPAAESFRTSAYTAIRVLSELFEDARGQAAILVSDLDSARAAGLQCEREYAAVYDNQVK